MMAFRYLAVQHGPSNMDRLLQNGFPQKETSHIDKALKREARKREIKTNINLQKELLEQCSRIVNDNDKLVIEGIGLKRLLLSNRPMSNRSKLDISLCGHEVESIRKVIGEVEKHLSSGESMPNRGNKRRIEKIVEIQTSWQNN